jgi:hypothetical protein
MGATTASTSSTHDELAASSCFEHLCSPIINPEFITAHGCGKHFDL